ncbi:MAG TPA: hypothetical protein VN706_21455, partial [Gemmatimonadaceae bacterium]|nr:hypothetical protein [Gemmatimonadaceae bacterium]
MAASLNALRRWWLLDCAHHDTRGAAAFVGLSVAFVASIATACIDKPIVSAPVSGARASLSLAVSETHALAALARSIDIDASYSRTSGERVVLLRQSVPVTSTGTQQVPLQVDLSSCLADAQRDGGGSTCPLRLTILLRDSTSTGTLDSTEVGP